MLFSLLKHYLYLYLYITDIALKVSQSLHCFTTSMSHGVENYFPKLWGTGIFDAIFNYFIFHDQIFKNHPTFYFCSLAMSIETVYLFLTFFLSKVQMLKNTLLYPNTKK